MGLENSRDQYFKTKTKTAEFRSRAVSRPRPRSRGLQDWFQVPWVPARRQTPGGLSHETATAGWVDACYQHHSRDARHLGSAVMVFTRATTRGTGGTIVVDPYLCLCICLPPQAGVVPKRLDGSSRLFWHGGFFGLHCKKIWISLQIAILHTGTFPETLDSDNFVTARLSSQRLVNLVRQTWTLSVTNWRPSSAELRWRYLRRSTFDR